MSLPTTGWAQDYTDSSESVTITPFYSFKTGNFTFTDPETGKSAEISIDIKLTQITSDEQMDTAYSELSKEYDKNKSLGTPFYHLRANAPESIQKIYDLENLNDNEYLEKYDLHNKLEIGDQRLDEGIFSAAFGGRFPGQVEDAQLSNKQIAQSIWKKAFHKYLLNPNVRRGTLAIARVVVNGSAQGFSLLAQGLPVEAVVMWATSVGLMSGSISFFSNHFADLIGTDKFYKKPKNYLLEKLKVIASKLDSKMTAAKAEKAIEKYGQLPGLIYTGMIPSSMISKFIKWGGFGYVFIWGVQGVTTIVSSFYPEMAVLNMTHETIAIATALELLSQGPWEIAAETALRKDTKKIINDPKFHVDFDNLTMDEVKELTYQRELALAKAMFKADAAFVFGSMTWSVALVLQMLNIQAGTVAAYSILGGGGVLRGARLMWQESSYIITDKFQKFKNSCTRFFAQ